MALSAFDDKSRPPQAKDLAGVLGRAMGAWEALHEHLAVEYAPMTEQWSFSGVKYGWSLRLIQKKRTILYMTPQEKRFQVGFALGEKAVSAVRGTGLSRVVLDVVDNATKYAEGRAVRLEVRYKKDLPDIEKLAAAKMAN